MSFFPYVAGEVAPLFVAPATVTLPADATVNGLVIDDTGAGRTGQLFLINDHNGSPIMGVGAAGGPKVFGDDVSAGQGVFGPFVTLDGPNIALFWSGSGQRIFSGTGAPAGALAGSNIGDVYFRQDTPSTANQRIYIKTGTAAWTGVV